MNIAIFGANSRIAQDLISLFNSDSCHRLFLFGRRPSEIEDWIGKNNFTKMCSSLTYEDLNDSKYDAIFNFVGVSDPEKILIQKENVYEINHYYDQLALNYLADNPNCKYIYISSGAAYLSDFLEPASSDTSSKINLNDINKIDWYSLAKFSSEIRHKALDKLSVIDLRIFSYFSSNLDSGGNFFINDIIRAISNNQILEVSNENFVRDYINPLDLFQLVKIILSKKNINCSLDLYTKSPVSKYELLEFMKLNYGLEYKISKKLIIKNSTGIKRNYYSIFKKAATLGYKPKFSSIDGIVFEIAKMDFNLF